MTHQHTWKCVFSAGEDAPGKSKDFFDICECGAVRHDYRHNGGKTSPNFPVVYERGYGGGWPPSDDGRT